MKLGEPDLTHTFRIFLSSGDDALTLRDRIDGLVSQAINPELMEANERVRFEVDRGERTAAQSGSFPAPATPIARWGRCR